MRYHLLFCLATLAWSALAQASPCTVGNPDAFLSQLQKTIAGECRNDQNISELQLTKTMDIYLDNTLILEGGSHPIRITANPEATVRFIGSGISIKRDQVELNHLTIRDFSGSGIQIEADDVRLQNLEIADNSLSGVSILKGENVILVDNRIHHNGEYGVFVRRGQVEIISEEGEASIHHHPQAGVFVQTGAEVKVSQVSFYENESGIQTEGPALPRPIGLVGIPSGGDRLTISGYIPLSLNPEDPFRLGPVRYDDLIVEIYLTDLDAGAQGRKFIGVVEDILPDGTFQVELSAPTSSENAVTALAVNEILNVSSTFSQPASLDPGNSDPQNPDSDGDGLEDGLEKELRLDPQNPDSDDDCLPDGLEAGVTQEKIISLRQESMRPPLFLQLPPSCLAPLQKAGLLPPEDGLFFDLDPETTTDPTQADSDGDGIRDGNEDWNLNGKREEIETDATRKDSDEDGLEDGDEMEAGTDGTLKDTDGDGVFDGDEVNRWQTDPLVCDTDRDGLGDGLETSASNTNASAPECRGLPSDGTNFQNSGELDPLKTDSDVDGLADGEEDENQNGWLDPGETDPTAMDSDGDSLRDGLENQLDQDQDGVIDLDLNRLGPSERCVSLPEPKDLDCDGFVNAQDLDSDEDGCLDSEEGLGDRNQDGILDVWDGKTGCGAATSPPPPSGPIGSEDLSQDKENAEALPSEVVPAKGGGACWLNQNAKSKNQKGMTLLLLMFLGGLLLWRKEASQRKAPHL